MFTRFINLQFFDEEPGNPAATPKTPADPDYSDMTDADFQKAMDGIRFANFNDDDVQEDTDPDDPSVLTDETETPASKAVTEDVNQPKEPVPGAQTAPAPVTPQPQYERYAPLIGALENDPDFRQALVDAMIARRNGTQVSAAQPLPEQQQKQQPDEDKEPVQGDDELLEEFEKRHGIWETRQQEKRTRAVVEKALMEERVARTREALFKRASDVNELLQKDTEAPVVNQFFRGNPAPPRLMQLMNEDPDTFMYVYDGMRQIIGKGNYFAEVFMARKSGAQQVPHPTTQPIQEHQSAAQPQANPLIKPNQQPSARTVVKGPAAPYTEGAGGNSKGGGGTEGPDFVNMSDKDFALYTERIKMQGI